MKVTFPTPVNVYEQMMQKPGNEKSASSSGNAKSASSSSNDKSASSSQSKSNASAKPKVQKPDKQVSVEVNISDSKK